VLTTLEEFASRDVLGHSRTISGIIEAGLVRLKEFPFVARIRGEEGGMVWGVECGDHAGRNAGEWANALVLACYHGDGPKADGIHLLGPLSRKVVRIAPPLVLTETEARGSMDLMHRSLTRLANAMSHARPRVASERREGVPAAT
jgi:4-aminobutyrate aminotransferase-like enzyme